jgi:enamine deaminase RidA (YjgF/YER057c/UK114 family)
VTTFPARTAREIPTFGSYGTPTGNKLAHDPTSVQDSRPGGDDDLDGIPTHFHRYHCCGPCCFGFSPSARAQTYIKGERPQQRGYSLAVITEGGKTVWLGGQIATVDDAGKSLAGDFEGQVRQIFKLIDATLKKAGGKLSNMVQMTVFITDVRNGDRLTEIRREIFGDNFPGSALITVTALADPNAKIEIQGYAVIGGK